MITDLQNFSTAFRKKADTLFSERGVSFLIKGTFIFSDDTQFEMSPHNILGLTYNSAFLENYRDVLHLDVALSRNLAIEISKHKQDIKINLHIFAITTGTTVPKLIKNVTYNAILSESTDIDILVAQRSINCSAQHEEQSPDLIVSFELIEESMFKLRKTGLCGLYRNVTMEAMVRHLAEMLGFSKIYFKPPDQELVYTNFIIPAFLDISDIFDYLQRHDGYDGVYKEGMNYYVHDNVLYVLPKLMPSDWEHIVNFFNLSTALDAGHASNHVISEQTLNVAITEPIALQDYTMQRVENFGTKLSAVRPKDSYGATSIADDTFIINDKLVSTLELNPEDMGFSKRGMGQVHCSKNNYTCEYEDILASTFSSVAFTWGNAFPFLITPAHSVKLIVDNIAGMKNIRGITQSITYVFAKTGDATSNIFNCAADVRLLLNKNDTI